MNADLARLTTPASPSYQVRAGVFGPIRDRTMPAATHLAIWIISVAAFVFYAVASVLRQQQFKGALPHAGRLTSHHPTGDPARRHLLHDPAHRRACTAFERGRSPGGH